MFRDVYKEAHKEIAPDKELLQKVIAMADEKSSKENKKTKIIPLYTYASIAAAVLLITVSAVIYTNLSPIQTDEKNVQNTLVENIQPKIEEGSNSENKDKKTEITPSLKNEQKLSEEPVLTEEQKKEGNQSPKNTVFGKYSEKESDKNLQNEQQNLSTEENTQKSENDIQVASQDTIRVMMNINSITPENNISARLSVPSMVSEEEIPNSIYETWSEEEYKNYIGIDIKTNVSVPEDMILFENSDFSIEKNPETNEIINDENSYYYETDYQRFIIIATSRITDEHRSFLDETKYQISEFNETNATITYDGSLYNAYLITDETGIKITAGGISDEELKKTIISITERN